jgi:hypothetical protein
VELLQDFSFPSSSVTVAMSGDGRYIVGTGGYPPRLRVWDTLELSLKFERYCDAAVVGAALLGDDYGKLVRPAARAGCGGDAGAASSPLRCRFLPLNVRPRPPAPRAAGAALRRPQR